MKNIGLALVLLLAFASGLRAQVTVEVLMDQDQFLPNEALPVRVRLVNHSGQTLHFGSEVWLSYAVEASDGLIVLKSGEAPVAHDFEVKASEMATARADLAPYFNIAKPGRYAVTATVRIKDWDMQVSSAPKHFDVIRGVTLWEQDFGVPQPAEDHRQPEVRKYVLQQATLAHHVELYLRLTDGAGSRTMHVIPFGPVISFSDPQTRVDQQSNLHVLYQSGAHVYNYSVVSPEGEITTHQTYVYSGSSPHLRVDEMGNIKIIGGARHLAENDVPSNRKANLTNEIPLPIH